MFEKISTQEHYLLLALFHGFSLPENSENFLKSLQAKTLVQQNSRGDYYINKRGVAFIHQQRDPWDVEKFSRAPRGFLMKIHNIVCVHEGSTKIIESIANLVEDKETTRLENKSEKWKPSYSRNGNFTLGDKLNPQEKKELLVLQPE